MLVLIIIIVVIVVALVGFAVAGFNKLRKSDIGAQEALGGIDVQLTRRAELIPNLVNTVKGYAAHESEVFEEVAKARAGLQAAAASDNVPAKAAADAAMQQALVKVNAVAEAYPQLQANQNFLQLQGQLTDTENQIAFARQYYNDATASLNKTVQTLPWMLFSGIANVHKRDFYDAPAGQDVAPTVDFGPATPAAPAAPITPSAPAAPAAPEAPAVQAPPPSAPQPPPAAPPAPSDPPPAQ